MQYLTFMQIQNESQHQIEIQKDQFIDEAPTKQTTLGSLIDSIQFTKKKTKPIKKNNTLSQTSSISSNQSYQNKQKSKLWTEEQNEKFQFLLKKHGPDFQLLGTFFQKKSKNQLKNKYKQHLIKQKKKAKIQDNKLKAVSLLFKQVDQKQEQN